MWYSILLFVFGSVKQGPTLDHLPFTLHNQGQINIEIRLKPDMLKDSGNVSIMPVKYILMPRAITHTKKPWQGSLSITRETDEPLYVTFTDLLRVNNLGRYLTEPGDNVVIRSNGNGFQFSGTGAEKYRLQYQLDSVRQSIPLPNNKRGIASFSIDSVGEYYAWQQYYQYYIDKGIPLIDEYKSRVSSFAFEQIKDNFIRGVIEEQSDRFWSVRSLIERKKMNPSIVLSIYDSSYSKILEQWIRHAVNQKSVGVMLAGSRLYRALNYDNSRINGNEMSLFIYRDLFRQYKGEERERLVVNNFPKQLMNDIGFTEEVTRLLDEYYADPAYPEWKAYVKKEEIKVRINHLRYITPEFTLVDKEGHFFTKDKLRGKFAVLCFWKSGNAESKKVMANLVNVEKTLAGNKKVVFVYISVDSSRLQWLKNISQTTNPNTVHVYTGGQGAGNEVIRRYAVTSYPTVYLLRPEGGVMNITPEIDFTKDDGKTLKELLLKEVIAIPHDGPYVWHGNSSATAVHIKDSTVAQKEFASNKAPLLSVQTDLVQTFQVKLQSALSIQPTEYARPEKLFVLSDIEGNFDAFRKLLQQSKVADQNYNWIFGKGHLVFAGDMFDRGLQVTECLWLIYSLEEKAKAAGGYVHFVLGNHEIMNLQGIHRYARDKYSRNAKLMGKTLTELYNENSELGRWLRTKNVIEKIGDMLFVHAGISPEVNRLSLTIEDINKMVRPYYDQVIDSSDNTLMTLYDSRYGEVYRISPFWSRGYYKSRSGKGLISNEQLDSTLNKFGVRKIVTGHTIVADTISVHYGGKIINTDTKHAEGKSEALLIEGDKFYRVNNEGRRVLLFIDDKRKATGK